MRQLLFIASFLFLLTSACKSHKDAAVQTGVFHPDSIFATLERQPCFGRCPAFYVTIYNSGKAVYEGHSTVEKLGRWNGTLTKDQMKQITDKAAEFHLDTLQNEYVNKYLVDFPGHSFSVILNGSLKRVTVMETQLPEIIYTFEKHMEEIISQVSWTKEEPKKTE